MNIKSDLKNDFFRRREVIVEVEAQRTPNFAEVQEQLAGEMKTDKSLIAVKSIRGGFGSNKFRIEAFVYLKPEDKTRFEPKPKPKKAVAATTTPSAPTAPAAPAVPAAPVAAPAAGGAK